MSNPNNLSDLIHQAENTAHQQSVARPMSKRKPIPFRIIFSALLVGLIAYAALKVSAALSPPTQAEVIQDLDVVLERAHQLVDEMKKDTGELPESLPNAALASVVKYEHDRTGYQLSATIMGVRVTLERNGKKTTETGVQ